MPRMRFACIRGRAKFNVQIYKKKCFVEMFLKVNLLYRIAFCCVQREKQKNATRWLHF